MIDDIGTSASAHLNRAHFFLMPLENPSLNVSAAPPSDRWYRLYAQLESRGWSTASYVFVAGMLYLEAAELSERGDGLPRHPRRAEIRQQVLQELDPVHRAVSTLLEHACTELDRPTDDSTSVGDTTQEQTLPEGPAMPPSMSPVDPLLQERLVTDAINGDARATERLLAEIHPLVLRYCRGRLGREETVIGSADDVAQEVCLAVLSALPNYTIKGSSFRAFVYGIASHKVTDAFRAIRRHRSAMPEQPPMPDPPDRAALHDGAQWHLSAAELTDRLSDLLTPHQREVLLLRVAAGLSVDETALTARCSPGAVRVTQHRALSRLREILATAPAEDDSA